MVTTVEEYERHLQRSCAAKRAYPTRAQAKHALRLLRHDLGRRAVSVYHCDFGPHFHLGHRTPLRKRVTIPTGRQVAI